MQEGQTAKESVVVSDGQAVTTSMEGGGFYNRHSDLQAAGIEAALPVFEEAARLVPVGGTDPLVIVDYGSSQGRNSMRPMRLAIETLRRRAGSNRLVEVVHTDLPSNDFASLFAMLEDDHTSYLANTTGVFPSAIGRSYFQSILPPGRVHLGWNSWTLQWLSRNPINVSDHVLAQRSASASARDAVDRQGREDWLTFLAARSDEMREGARLVTLMVARTATSNSFERIFDQFWQVAIDMGREGLLSPEEQLRITIPAVMRSVEDVEDPFRSGTYLGLVLEQARVGELPDPFWNRYRATGDADEYGRAWSGMCRAVFGPVVRAALAPEKNANVYLDDFFCRLAMRLTASPQHEPVYFITGVLAKA